jgi:DNA processing protein
VASTRPIPPADDPRVVHLTPLDARYPSRLRALHDPPASLSARGGALESACVVAVVGSRDAASEALAFAHGLATELARADVVVASGGAHGIDAAAHRGALDARGRTWVVAGTGCRHCFPPEHAELFDTVAAGPGAVLWPFSADTIARPASFLTRNRVLVSLADAIVVVQAGARSGALHSASSARKLSKPLWVVPTPPWTRGFDGSHQLLDEGARPLTSIDVLLRSLSSRPPVVDHAPDGTSAEGGVVTRDGTPPLPAPEPGAHCPALPLSETESAVLGATGSSPRHLDEIALQAHASVHAASAALLTLALENVVVEGPPGFYRRRDASDR